MLGVLELGTNSLKLHRSKGDRERYQPVRSECEVGFDICSTGRLATDTMAEAIEHVARLLTRCEVEEVDTIVGVATGVFGEVENLEEFLARLRREVGVPVRVLSPAEQAQLLYLGFADRVTERPAMVFDLGCGRLEVVYLGVGEGRRYLHDSLPLGVIRLHQVASLLSGVLDEESARRYIEVKLRDAKRFSVPSAHGTGGTIRVLAQVAQTPELTREVLERVEREIRINGPPQFFSPRRQSILLPGVFIVRRLLDHVDASVVHHHRVDLGVVLLERLQPFYRSVGARLREVFVDREIDILNW